MVLPVSMVSPYASVVLQATHSVQVLELTTTCYLYTAVRSSSAITSLSSRHLLKDFHGFVPILVLDPAEGRIAPEVRDIAIKDPRDLLGMMSTDLFCIGADNDWYPLRNGVKGYKESSGWLVAGFAVAGRREVEHEISDNPATVCLCIRN